jgi:hypothetical protein
MWNVVLYMYTTLPGYAIHSMPPTTTPSQASPEKETYNNEDTHRMSLYVNKNEKFPEYFSHRFSAFCHQQGNVANVADASFFMAPSTTDYAQ